MNCTLNEAEDVLNRYSGGMLLSGSHDAPNAECKMCVRELRHPAECCYRDRTMRRMPNVKCACGS